MSLNKVNDQMIIHFYVFCTILKIASCLPNVNNQITRLFPKKNEPSSFEKCYSNLGCIEVTEQWYHEDYRPINVQPLARHIIRTEFILYSLPQGSKKDMHHLDYQIISAKEGAINQTRFNSKQDVVFIIHDFTSNGFTGWVRHLSTGILSGAPKNVISVNWQSGAEPPYEQAVANARVVALEIVSLLKSVHSKYHIGGNKIHIIGHGVGAHIAGYVGKKTKGVKKITGLDPSGPYFDGMPKFVRLDSTDAKYVEVIHSDAYGLDSQGGSEHFGHRDFFINGPYKQPGCNDSSSNLNLLSVTRNSLRQDQILPGCSHKRSFKYYIESVESKKCKFIGFACENFNKFTEGLCTSEVSVFNVEFFERAGRVQDKMYFLMTSSQSPFCKIPYKVEIAISNYTQASEKQLGHIELLLKGSKNEMTNATSFYPGIPQEFLKGELKSLIVYSTQPEITKFEEVKVKWVKKGASMCPPLVCQSSLFVNSIRITLLPNELDKSFDFCPENKENELKHNVFHSFKSCPEKCGRIQRYSTDDEFYKEYNSKGLEYFET